MQTDLTHFFAPRAVALIGASPNPKKLSFGVLRNLTRSGFRGDVFLVNPRYPVVDGLTCYPTIAAVPAPVELAVLVLPTRFIPQVLRECGQCGVKAATIISNGFKESGAAGAALETECLAIARQHGMRLIGPNCVGTIDLTTGLNTTFIEGMPPAGPIGFVSQSGGICGAAIDHFIGQDIGLSKFVSLGNEADVTETDVISYLGRDPATRVIAAYVEGITAGRRFMTVARQVAQSRPIVLLKAGRTRAGEQAVSSHTGALAGSNQAYTAALQQSGVVEAATLGDLFAVSLAFASQPLPAGDRVFVLSNSGGPAALMADHLSELGLSLPLPTAETQAALQAALTPEVNMANPLDMLGGAGPEAYQAALPPLLADPAIDLVLVVLVPHLLLNPTETASRICRVAHSASKPIVACFVGSGSVAEARALFHRQHIPMYTLPETACRAVQAMCSYARWRRRPPQNPLPLPDIDMAQARQLLAAARVPGTLGEAETRPLLQACHIPVAPGAVAHSEAEALTLARRLAFPVALKLASPALLHKTEAGGVRLNLPDAPAVQTAYRALRQANGANGVLVEKMISGGTEVIVGVRRDPQFGPLLMFGLGGIYVELLTDVAFRVAPIDHAEALEMIGQTKAGRLLHGQRGAPPADINAVARCLTSLSQLALAFPQIDSIEINPLHVSPAGVLALDGRVVLARPPGLPGNTDRPTEQPL